MNPHALFDIFQVLVVTALVAGCTLYCLLKLAPDIIKHPLRQALLRCPLPGFVKAKLQKTSTAGACGVNCGGCGSGAANPVAPQAVKWHARKP